MLWTGVSLAKEGERISLLTLGVKKQLGLSDLFLTAPPLRGSEALEMVFNLLSYVVSRGEALPEGPSPIDPAERVWRIDL